VTGVGEGVGVGVGAVTVANISNLADCFKLSPLKFPKDLNVIDILNVIVGVSRQETKFCTQVQLIWAREFILHHSFHLSSFLFP